MKNTLNEMVMNEQELDMVNGGTCFQNTFKKFAYEKCGMEVKEHFFDRDEFILPDGKIIYMEEADEIVRAYDDGKLAKATRCRYKGVLRI